MTLRRPNRDEHIEYYGLYIDQAPEGDILQVLVDELESTRQLLAGLSPEAEVFRYSPGKWNIRQIIGHLIDTEWTFAYRGLCFARADPAVLAPFDQELWARTSNAADRPLSSLLEEFGVARRASLAAFHGFGDAEWDRTGIANDCPFSVRCMPFILAGHERHHHKVIVEQYLR